MRNKAIGSEHEHHMITLVPTDKSKYKKNTTKNSHVSKIYCCTCQKPLNFASVDEWNYWNEKKYTHQVYKEFIDDFISHGPKREVKFKAFVPDNKYIIYLEVPFSKKDIVKNLGAKWDPQKKKWYIYNDNTNIERLNPWIHPDDEALLVAPKKDKLRMLLQKLNN